MEFFSGILASIVAAIVISVALVANRHVRNWIAFRPYHGVWSCFTAHPTLVVQTGKEQGHTLKVSANESDAVSQIMLLLKPRSKLGIAVTNGEPLLLQDRNVISVGGARSNDATQAFVRSLAGTMTVEYTTDNDLIVNGEIFRSEYKNNVLVRDYAFVCKAANPFSPTYKFLIFAGNHGLGTQAAVLALTSRHEAANLFRAVGDADFYAIVSAEIDRHFAKKPLSVAIVRCGLLQPPAGPMPVTNWESRREKLRSFLVSLGCNDNYIRHVQERASLAVVIARMIETHGDNLDSDAVFFGAMFHDIGRTVTQGLDHGVRGAEILKDKRHELERDFAISPTTFMIIVECAECHILGGIRKEWIEGAHLELLPRHYVPQSIEAKIVAFCDQILHDWNSYAHVFREAPQYDQDVYKQFYALTYDIIAKLFLSVGSKQEEQSDVSSHAK